MKRVLLVVLCVILVFSLVACGKAKTNTETNVAPAENTSYEPVVEPIIEPVEENTPAEETDMGGYAGMNIPLKDNNPEAEYQIKVAVQNLFKETYGDSVFDARINVDKIYTAEDEDANPTLKEMNLGPDKVAFEISYDIKPAEGVDPVQFTVPNGEYDEDAGWVKGCSRLGILVPNEETEGEYKIINYGTGW